MGKSLYIAEKPSVAQEFAKALKENMQRHDGYQESEHTVITWCVGHLVTMSYPEAYDEKMKKWSFDTLPFLPKEYKYEIIGAVKKQFQIVKELLTRADVDTIYVCTDSGREGEYIYRLVAMMAGVKDKVQKRVWIDSQTEEEISRGIREARDLSAYDHLSDSAFLRAKEDYLMGINFSRALSLKYGYAVNQYLGGKYQAIAAGRVMTCVLGMVVRRERKIREFVKTPFYRVIAKHHLHEKSFDGEWRAVEGSRYVKSPLLYKENGFKEKKDAEELKNYLENMTQKKATIEKLEQKKERKKAPLLYNLAELQNDCSKMFKISPDQTLSVVQELYEKKLVTYPRTDARVLSTAVAREIDKNLKGLTAYQILGAFAREILDKGTYKEIANSRYTNDKQITDHYAIVPTGQGLSNLSRMPELNNKVYQLIARRFLSIFYPPAEYKSVALETVQGGEHFFANFKVLVQEGYLTVVKDLQSGKNEETVDKTFLEWLSCMKRGSQIPLSCYEIREGETAPPKRYTSGSMILAMENAGQLIEDEELRAQIKGSGIGTSATRAEILKKLFHIKYLTLNKKTQVITPSLLGEMVFDVVDNSIRPLLNPELTASWEKGLSYVAEGTVTPGEYMKKLEDFVSRHTRNVYNLRNQNTLKTLFDRSAGFYKKHPDTETSKKTAKR